MGNKLFTSRLAVVKQYIDNLLVSRVAILAEHYSMQASVSILTFNIDISANFNKFLHYINIFGGDGLVKWRVPIFVLEVKFHSKMSFDHLADVVNVITASCL